MTEMPKAAPLGRIKAGAKWSPGFNEKPTPPRLPALAQFIRETWPKLHVTLEHWTTSTDRKLPGTRVRWPGKGRKGRMLKVVDPKLDPQGFGYHGILLQHESGETYRHNGEVCEWIIKRLKGKT